MWRDPSINKHWKVVLSALCFILVIGLGIVKVKVGYETFVLGFLLIPIYLTTWRVNRFMGMTIGVFSALTWLAALSFMPPPDFSPSIFYWNATAKVGFILITTLVFGFLKARLDKETESARKDPLTNISNRRDFFEIATQELNRSRRYNRPLTVACLDVDGFKKVNDQMGHKAGDSLLRLISIHLKKNLRVVDVVARIGGDEFAVLLPETDQVQAMNVLRELRERLLREVVHDGFPVTFSIGAVTSLTSPSSIDDLLKSADDLMYSAKNNGKDRVIHAFVQN